MADYAFQTLEDRQKIEKLWEDGRTPKEISETMGVSIHVVYNELTRGQDRTCLGPAPAVQRGRGPAQGAGVAGAAGQTDRAAHRRRYRKQIEGQSPSASLKFRRLRGASPVF